MSRYEPLDRRSFITQLGKGVLGITVVGGVLAACGDDDDARVATTSALGATTAPSEPPVGTTGAPTATVAEATTTTAPSDSGTSIERVNLGFVSAYVVVRGTTAAIVDTGVGGSGASIEAALSGVGLGWADVGDVILTHLHGDHVGSLGEVMAGAQDAVGYAGAADIDGIASPRPLVAVGDGDRVFGLDIIETPGHTPGHISVFEPEGRLLVAGDAINGAGSGSPGSEAGVGGANPRFTADMSTAEASVAKMAALAPTAIYFGHGEPLVSGAADSLSALAGG